MGYVEKSLVDNEHVVFKTRLHWFIYLPGILLLPLIIGFFILPVAWVRRITSEFAVTNRRVIIKTGWITRQTIEMNISKVESIDVDQGFIARLFNYGTIRVIGTGGSREPFGMIADPLGFRRAVQSQIA